MTKIYLMWHAGLWNLVASFIGRDRLDPNAREGHRLASFTSIPEALEFHRSHHPNVVLVWRGDSVPLVDQIRNSDLIQKHLDCEFLSTIRSAGIILTTVN
jgi:hypothetical protein